ncbi:PLP-dependent cysteine synthase family protein [Halomonas binhaiensis]|uniref:L-cysteine desulfhydrase Cds1 n=1 Tax=Halomonas binhaiensis TaxID=2562282 RepID=A0A5C1NMN8_9GAMM|nr:PLP-dependent cysteine synthase family protein [Halomonas binhaiensis]QEM83783.1 PLP-dependent cysteine synthase family protein [Halomonas binhaiensis]
MCEWVRNAMRLLDSDQRRSADTHLYRLDIPGLEAAGIDIYLKDESTHPSGSLKHRLARSLFLHAICSGKIQEGTPVIEASSGSTAVSEAYFARLLGLPFTAVMPASTAGSKIAQIERLGGTCHFVTRSSQVYTAARQLSEEREGHYMDQFTYAESATDWRGNNNIAESIFRQMEMERHATPYAVVMSAGTGGTSATIGRYIRYCGHATRLVVVDPENSVFHDSYQRRDPSLTIEASSRIEGIGRPRVEPSFLPEVIDEMLQVADASSIAAIHWLEQRLGRKAGGSTGTNLWGALTIAQRMRSDGHQGSIVTLMCDGGERYLDTYYDADWIKRQFGSLEQPTTWLNSFL